MVVLIGLAHALCVLVFAAIWRSRKAMWFGAALSALVAFGTGNWSYIAVDLSLIVVACFVCLGALPPKAPTPPPEAASKPQEDRAGLEKLLVVAAVIGVAWLALSTSTAPVEKSSSPVGAGEGAPAPPISPAPSNVRPNSSPNREPGKARSTEVAMPKAAPNSKNMQDCLLIASELEMVRCLEKAR
jgi:hypothetical protein